MLLSIAVGAWIGRHQKSTTDYFLGGRQIPWLAVTFSIVATETSVLTFISIPASVIEIKILNYQKPTLIF